MFVYLLLVFCTILPAYSYAPLKIVGGRDVSDAVYPFFVRIFYQTPTGDFERCGGTILNSRHVLTAAHCLENKAPSNFTVRVAYHSRFRAAYDVEEIITHGKTDKGGYHDVGILKTTKDIVYHSGYVETVTLTSADYHDEGSSAEIIGYGRLSEEGRSPSKLQRLETKIYNDEKCKMAYNRTVKDERWICAYSGVNEGFCAGDSGGPLLANGLQIGVIAHGDCEGERPDVFASVYFYLDWIKQQLEET